MKKIKIVQLIGIILFVVYSIFIILNTVKMGIFKDSEILIFSI